MLVELTRPICAVRWHRKEYSVCLTFKIKVTKEAELSYVGAETMSNRTCLNPVSASDSAKGRLMGRHFWETFEPAASVDRHWDDTGCCDLLDLRTGMFRH